MAAETEEGIIIPDEVQRVLVGNTITNGIDACLTTVCIFACKDVAHKVG